MFRMPFFSSSKCICLAEKEVSISLFVFGLGNKNLLLFMISIYIKYKNNIQHANPFISFARIIAMAHGDGSRRWLKAMA
jgi:hypothetical protein